MNIGQDCSAEMYLFKPGEPPANAVAEMQARWEGGAAQPSVESGPGA